METPQPVRRSIELNDLPAVAIKGGGSVWGTPAASDSRTYWVDVTSPFGETVTFGTTWGEVPSDGGW